MAEIKYGKGIGGFLGSMPTIDYQYTPMPFNEMLSMAQMGFKMREANNETTGEINKLYDSSVLGVDQPVFDQKQEAFAGKLKDEMSKAGGSLGQLNSFLNQELRAAGADKTYVGATNSVAAYKQDLADTAKNVKDPILQQFYPQKALSAYSESGGAATGASYSPIAQRSNLTYTDAQKVISSAVSRVQPQITQRLNQVELDGTTGDQLVTYKQKEYQNLKNHLTELVNHNLDLQRYYSDIAEATGQDYETVVNKVIESEAKMGQIFDYKEGKISQSAGSKRQQPYIYTGPASAVDLEGMYGADNVQDALKNLEAETQNDAISQADYTAKRSLLQNAANKAGLTPDDLASIKRPSYGYPQSGGSQRGQQREAEALKRKGFKSVGERFQTSFDEITENATMNPDYSLYEPTKGVQKQAIAALSNMVGYTDDMVVQSVVVNNEWESVEDQTDINLFGANIESVSTRPYWDNNTNQSVVKVQGKLKPAKTGELGSKFEAIVPVTTIAGVNQDLKAFYASPTMNELSRLMVKGQKVSGARLNEFTEVVRQVSDDPNVQNLNNAYAVEANEDGTYSIVLIDKVTTESIKTDLEEVTAKTLTELSIEIDRIIQESAKQ